MAGKRQQVNVPPIDIDRDAACTLRHIEQEQLTFVMGFPACLLHVGYLTRHIGTMVADDNTAFCIFADKNMISQRTQHAVMTALVIFASLPRASTQQTVEGIGGTATEEDALPVGNMEQLSQRLP